MRKNLTISLFVLLAAVLVLSACGPASTPVEEPVVTDTQVPTTVPATATEDPLAMYMPDAVIGEIVSAGSSTVFPLSERMKQRFEEEGFTGVITIEIGRAHV